jgi:hypothetical protein
MWAETVCCNFSFNIYLMWPDPGQLSAFGGHSSIGRSKSPCGRLAAVGRSPARFLPSSGPLPGPIGPRPALGIDPGPSSRRLQSGLRSQSNVRAEIAQCEHSEESGGLLNTSGKAALGHNQPLDACPGRVRFAAYSGRKRGRRSGPSRIFSRAGPGLKRAELSQLRSSHHHVADGFGDAARLASCP